MAHFNRMCNNFENTVKYLDIRKPPFVVWCQTSHYFQEVVACDIRLNMCRLFGFHALVVHEMFNRLHLNCQRTEFRHFGSVIIISKNYCTVCYGMSGRMGMRYAVLYLTDLFSFHVLSFLLIGLNHRFI